MTDSLIPNGEQQYCDENGVPYAAGQVYYYVPNTLTFKDTFQDAAGTILNTNPITLDAAGRCVAFGHGDYRQVLVDVNLVEVWDKLVSAPLPGDAISDAMAPIVAASTVLQARQLLQVDSLVQASIAAVQLMPGPTGPASTVPGPTGPTGAQGPTGPAGSSGGGGTGAGTLYTGLATTTSAGFLPGLGGGQLTVTFPTPFPTALTYFSVSMPPDPSFTGFSPAAVGIYNADVNHVYCQVYDGEGNGLEDTQVAWVAMGY